MMKPLRICHIKGEKNYWINKDHTYKWCNVDPNITTNVVIETWNNLCKIEYYKFRKIIRDIIFKKIISTNEFDIICNDNESLLDIISDTSIQKNNILYYGQDDDDLFLGGITSEFYNPGVYHTINVRIDPIEFCKKYRHFIKNHYYSNTDINLSLFHFPGKDQRNNSPVIVNSADKLLPLLEIIGKNKYDTHLIGTPESELYKKYLHDIPLHVCDCFSKIRTINGFEVIPHILPANICNRHICTHNIYPHSLTFIKRFSNLFFADIILQEKNMSTDITEIFYFFIKSWLTTAKKLKFNNKEWLAIVDLYVESF